MASLNPRRYRRLLVRLRDARITAGLSQREVAKKLRKPQSFVSKCEVGERRIDPIELQIFASIYKKPLRFFYEED